MTVDGTHLSVRIPLSAESWCQSHQQGEQVFLLIARDVVDESIAHYLLLLERVNGRFERVCAVLLMIPKRSLPVLRSLNLRREGLLLA